MSLSALQSERIAHVVRQLHVADFRAIPPRNEPSTVSTNAYGRRMSKLAALEWVKNDTWLPGIELYQKLWMRVKTKAAYLPG